RDHFGLIFGVEYRLGEVRRSSGRAAAVRNHAVSERTGLRFSGFRDFGMKSGEIPSSGWIFMICSLQSGNEAAFAESTNRRARRALGRRARHVHGFCLRPERTP